MTFARKGNTNLVNKFHDSVLEWKSKFFYARLVTWEDSWGIKEVARACLCADGGTGGPSAIGRIVGVSKKLPELVFAPTEELEAHQRL
ncbi:hypothetical protein ACLOJK_007013, partial [Asimina triloba]